ncbi:uncharacterized protein LOC134656802 [Cydia amplana]|uniref:uncharacterized protein LOC134656802 n=1 Tax=Cydia amplana TaxID=1869771 RepID=UPI002FE5E330
MRGFLILLTLCLVFSSCEMKRKKVRDYPTEKQLTLQRKETTPVDFTRLLVMRVVYGVAKMMGFQEQVGNVLNGALVPPGADDDDDDDFFGDDDDDDGIFGGDDDY